MCNAYKVEEKLCSRSHRKTVSEFFNRFVGLEFSKGHPIACIVCRFYPSESRGAMLCIDQSCPGTMQKPCSTHGNKGGANVVLALLPQEG